MPRKPVEQEYESKHQNLLAQQERRLQDAWNVVLVFPDTDWEAYSYYWLIVNTRSFFSSGLTKSLQRIGMVPWPLCLLQITSIMVMVLSVAPFASPFRILAR